MTIEHTTKTTAKFKIETVGGNAHICELEGEISNSQSVFDIEGETKACVVYFRKTGAVVNVSTNGAGSCRQFCGMRAMFTGRYIKPAAGCASDEVKLSREEFKHLYDSKKYAKAYKVINSVLKNCALTLSWLEIGWIRNDLAITEFKLGRLSDCRRTLQSLAEDAAMTDGALRDRYPPTDFDNYLPIIQATRTNLRLCGGTFR